MSCSSINITKKKKKQVKIKTGQGRVGEGDAQNLEVPTLVGTHAGADSMWERGGLEGAE